MRSFFKIFFASLLAMVVFIGLGILFMVIIVGSLASTNKVSVGDKAVLYIDLNQTYLEQAQQNPVAALSSGDQYDYPGVYDIVRMIRYAKSDSSIKGIYLKCNDNQNGFATSEEIRNALIDFKTSKKFIFAYGEVIPQRAYYVGNIATRIYCNPKGGVEWKGYSLEYVFFKQTLERLNIDPQVIYAGKYKSATEPFREEKMTEANKMQSMELIGYLYNQLLQKTSKARGIDTATLHSYANGFLIQTANDAYRYRLVDGLKYDDEVQGEIKERINIKQDGKINFVPIGEYAQAVNFKTGKSLNRIALIYAQGDIIDGKSDQGQIGSETFRGLVRKARFDKDVKAIVFRVNSGGGSALASENIWRELSVARKDKPVIISFGDVAASGGYYLASNADSIFAQPNTITGSIGVFTIVPNMQDFFKNKLGVTFDGVKTAEHADLMSVIKPLSAVEKKYIQNEVDTIYNTFLTRVAEGRNLSMAMVDSIGQGRVWMGERAVGLGLVDKLGSLQDAIDCAARMGKVTEYRLKEYPEPQTIFDLIFGNYKKVEKIKALKEEMGTEVYNIYSSIKRVKEITGSVQMRLPFELRIN